jgi:hypothetical protein
VRAIDVLPVLYLSGLLSIAVTARRQRLGDLAAGTVVATADSLPVRPPVGFAAATVATLGTVAMVGVLLWSIAVVSEETLPSQGEAETLTRESLAAFSDAMKNGESESLTSRLGPWMRENFSEADLKAFAAGLAAYGIGDFDAVIEAEFAVSAMGRVPGAGDLDAFAIEGTFASEPRLLVRASFEREDAEWKILGLNVNVVRAIPATAP